MTDESVFETDELSGSVGGLAQTDEHGVAEHLLGDVFTRWGARICRFERYGVLS